MSILDGTHETEPPSVDIGGVQFVFQVNFDGGVGGESQNSIDTLAANEAHFYSGLVWLGLGCFVEEPATSNGGNPVDGVPFYRRADVMPDTIKLLRQSVAASRPDAFEGWDGEVSPPSTLTLLGRAEVGMLIEAALYEIDAPTVPRS